MLSYLAHSVLAILIDHTSNIHEYTHCLFVFLIFLQFCYCFFLLDRELLFTLINFHTIVFCVAPNCIFLNGFAVIFISHDEYM